MFRQRGDTHWQRGAVPLSSQRVGRRAGKVHLGRAKEACGAKLLLRLWWVLSNLVQNVVL